MMPSRLSWTRWTVRAKWQGAAMGGQVEGVVAADAGRSRAATDAGDVEQPD
ncbi:hypothetical protein BTZ20_0308 [Rhodococcus sp. MTM3W5.2]|nr:hypothetical protein BTZ20_0308 [Rhodococcus sp. MTM3W5.2]